MVEQSLWRVPLSAIHFTQVWLWGYSHSAASASLAAHSHSYLITETETASQTYCILAQGSLLLLYLDAPVYSIHCRLYRPVNTWIDSLTVCRPALCHSKTLCVCAGGSIVNFKPQCLTDYSCKLLKFLHISVWSRTFSIISSTVFQHWNLPHFSMAFLVGF